MGLVLLLNGGEGGDPQSWGGCTPASDSAKATGVVCMATPATNREALRWAQASPAAAMALWGRLAVMKLTACYISQLITVFIFHTVCAQEMVNCLPLMDVMPCWPIF